MTWDLGLRGVGLLFAMSLGFGVLAQFVAGRKSIRWLWVVGTVAFLVGGLFASEVMFGWATEEDLQPNIDGLSFDEVLLFGLLFGVAAVVVTKLVTRRSRRRHSRERAPRDADVPASPQSNRRPSSA